MYLHTIQLCTLTFLLGISVRLAATRTKSLRQKLLLLLLLLLLTVKRPLMQIFQWKSGLHRVVWSKTLIRYVPCLMNASALENNFQREPTWTVTFLNFCYAMFCLSSGDLWYKRLTFETNVYSPDLCSCRHWKGTFIAIDIRLGCK